MATCRACGAGVRWVCRVADGERIAVEDRITATSGERYRIRDYGSSGRHRSDEWGVELVETGADPGYPLHRLNCPFPTRG